ncbi:hypothetical protein ACRQF6_07845 [Actinotignum sp. GS-2025f]|uniref:hypothetical protein n=1 Tax=unclassified Actinotignum TaxID=2632702 RepID=UPI002A82A82B|nr:hypothetical protein [Actinotignum sp. SLA_B059]MDY5127026.1 hypothetical protein [Actinotignum sp. SLA_B059]
MATFAVASAGFAAVFVVLAVLAVLVLRVDFAVLAWAGAFAVVVPFDAPVVFAVLLLFVERRVVAGFFDAAAFVPAGFFVAAGFAAAGVVAGVAASFFSGVGAEFFAGVVGSMDMAYLLVSSGDIWRACAQTAAIPRLKRRRASR